MFSFKQFCEFMTCNQRKSWFYLSNELLKCIPAEEVKQLCHVQKLDDEMSRVFYTKERFYRESKTMDKMLLYNLLNQAIVDEDYDKIKELKEYMAI